MRNYLLLTKPTICLLVVITAAAGLVWEGSMLSDPVRFIGVLVALYLAAGSANAFNQYFERDIDAEMARTAKKRPLAMRVMDPWKALVFAVLIGLAGTLILGFGYNWLAAALGVGTILYYSLFYTLFLKPRTPQNIVIGGVAGSMGPVIAWAAAAGNLAWPAVIMFLIIFLWTPPHFWALALCLKEDYEKSRLPMMPNVVGEEATLRQMIAYSIVLVLCSLGLLFFQSGWVYLVVAAACGLLFMAKVVQAMNLRTKKSYWGLFGYSIVYLFALFVAMMVDQAVTEPLLSGGIR